VVGVCLTGPWEKLGIRFSQNRVQKRGNQGSREKTEIGGKEVLQRNQDAVAAGDHNGINIHETETHPVFMAEGRVLRNINESNISPPDVGGQV